MNYIFYILLGVTVSMAIVFIVLSKGQTSLKSLVFKAIASFLFTVLGIFACFANGYGSGLNTETEIASMLFILGFIASCFGDIILALPDWERNSDIKNNLILSGGLAFAIAHVCYFVAMILLFGFAWYIILMALVFALFFYLFNVVVMKVDYGKMKLGIVVYALFVSIVTCQGIYSLIALEGSLFSILLALGFLFFYASDVVLMNIYFGNQKKNSFHYYFNLSFYYLAQILIATSLFFLV